MASPAAKIALLLIALSLGIVQCTADKDDFVCGISAEQLKKVLKHGSSQIDAATEIKCDIPALKMLLGAKERAEEKIDQRIDFVKKAEKKIEFALQRMQHSKKLRHSANHKTLQHKLETLKNTEKELMRRKSMSASKSPGTHMVKEMTGSHSVVEHKKMPHSKMPAQQSNYFPETKQVLLEKLDNMKNVVHDLEERMQQIESSKDESSPKNVVSDDYNDYSEMSDASRSGTIMYDSREGDYSEEMSHETKMPESSRSNEMSDNSYSDDMSEDWSDEEATDMDYDEELDYSNKRKKRSVQKPTDIHSLIQNLLGGLGKSEVGVLKKIVAALKEDDVESKGDSIKEDLLKLLKDIDPSVEDEMPQTRNELSVN